MKRYTGHRDGTDTAGRLAVAVVQDGHRRPLQHVVRHSPSGMNCGYWGSGPRDLALSLLSDYLGESDETRAGRLYLDFLEVVADLPVDRDWEITAAQIEAWLEEHADMETDMFYDYDEETVDWRDDREDEARFAVHESPQVPYFIIDTRSITETLRDGWWWATCSRQEADNLAWALEEQAYDAPREALSAIVARAQRRCGRCWADAEQTHAAIREAVEHMALRRQQVQGGAPRAS